MAHNDGVPQFIYTKELGFGILCDASVNDPQCRCFFEDGKIHKTDFHSDRSRVIKHAYDTDLYARYSYYRDFSNAAVSQAEKMQENSRFTFRLEGQSGTCRLYCDVETEGNLFSCLLSDYYQTDFECSCKKDCCCHAAASILALQKRIEKLKLKYLMSDLDVNKGLFLSSTMTNLINQILDKDQRTLSPNVMEDTRCIVSMLDNIGDENYCLLLYRYLINTSYYNYDAKMLEKNAALFLGLFESDLFRKAICESGILDSMEYDIYRQVKSNRLVLKRTYKAYLDSCSDIKNGIRKTSYSTEFLLKYRGDMTGLLKYYTLPDSSLSNENDKQFVVAIANSFRPEVYSNDTIKTFVTLLDQNYFWTEDSLRIIISKIPDDIKPETLQCLENITLDINDIKGMPRDHQKQLINSIEINEDAIDYIMQSVIDDCDDSFKGRFLLSAAIKNTDMKNVAFIDKLGSYASGLQYSRLLLASTGYFAGKKGRFRYSGKEKDTLKEIKLYFDTSYAIEREKSSIECLYYVKFGDYTIFEACESGTSKEFNQNPFTNLSYKVDEIKEACICDCRNKFETELDEKQENLDLDLFKTKNKNFSSNYEHFCQALNQQKVILSENSKAEVVYSLWYENKSAAMSFKIGNDKKYIVKDAKSFIKAFRTEETSLYGKGFSFTHSLSNLAEPDASIIQALTAGSLASGKKSDPKNIRFITVQSGLFAMTIEKLAGKNILFNDVPCLVRLAEKKVSVQITRNHCLELVFPDTSSTNIIMNLGNEFAYVVSGDENCCFIDKVKGTQEQTDFIEFVQDNHGVSVKPIISNFRKNIYSRFFDIIDVNPSVKDFYKLSTVKIEAYFDYENLAITLKDKYFKDEKETTPEDLTEKIDRDRYAMFMSYVSSLGFENGILSNESGVLSFLKMDFSKLRSMASVYLSDSLSRKQVVSMKGQSIRVTYKSSLMHVFLEESQFSQEELELIIKGLRKKKKFVLLDKDRIVDLDSEEARDFGSAVDDFNLDPKALYKKKVISMATAIKAFAHEKSCKADKYLRNMIDEIKSFKDADIEPPKLNAVLRPYQVEGFRWLSILSKYNMGGILADDMGLGKTIQMIALIKSDKTKKPSLIVCPKSLVFNWVSEFRRFDESTPVCEIYGNEGARSKIIESIDYSEKKVYVTSYDSMRLDISKYNGTFCYCVLDEAQYIKNTEAQKTKSAKEIKSVHRFALTGTPIENSIIDLWSIFDFIMPGYCEELSVFRSIDSAVIAKKVAPFVLRRIKNDVLSDLPPKFERILSADMNPQQRKLYDAMRQDASQKLHAGGKAFDILPYLTRLRQLCVDPAMFVDNYSGGSGKMIMLDSLIPEYLEKGHRILIFSQFVKGLNSVESILTKANIPYFLLTGDTPAKDRISMMDNFNNGEGADVFLISLKAGGTGLNLTGADTVIHLDPWWNTAAENQASDRTHRIGQKRNVEVIKLIASDTIEQRVLELQNIKKNLIDKVISNDDGSVVNASLEDISFILNC